MTYSWEDIFGVGLEINMIKHSQISLIVSNQNMQACVLLRLISLRSAVLMADQLCKVVLLVRLADRSQWGF